MPNGEERRTSNRTAQIVGGVVVLALVLALGYFFWGTGDEPAAEPEEQEVTVEEQEPAPPPEPELEMPGAVRDYIELAREPYQMPEGREKYRHEYTSQRLRSLGEALVDFGGLVDDANGDIEGTRDALKDRAGAIQVDWRDETHADDVRAAFLEAVEAFRTLESRVSGAGDAPTLRERARAIDREVLYLDQISKAEAFFSSTADRFESLFEALERRRQETDEGSRDES